MPKRMLQLSDKIVRLLRGYAETGMGFYVVKGHFPETYVDRDFVIGGNHYVLPFRHAEIFSVADLLDGRPLPLDAEQTANFVISRSAAARDDLSLPPGYKPHAPCVSVYASVSLPEPTVCCRFLGSASDPRLSDQTLAANTLLTTRLELNDVFTGFAAVARYALPLPSPASHVFEYELPAGTHLLIRTVPQCFTQMGGGVELRLCAPTQVTLRGYLRLSDF